MKNKKPVLYVKAGCPWCIEALNFFDKHGVDLEVCDVSENRDAMRRMMAVSGQTKVPTFELDDFIVSDFSVDEFQDALEHEPEVKRQLGLGDDED